MGIALRSQAFVHAYLRIDGNGINAPITSGDGAVNCQSGVADFEVLEEEVQSDGTVALASVAFPNVYVRMDGSGVTSSTASGGGVVNCAFGVGPWETFHRRGRIRGVRVCRFSWRLPADGCPKCRCLRRSYGEWDRELPVRRWRLGEVRRAKFAVHVDHVEVCGGRTVDLRCHGRWRHRGRGAVSYIRGA